MAKNEIVNVLTIKTEQSQQTIKGLKKEIADLKKSLDIAVIGSDDFERASKELAMAQAELKTVMADGKKTADNIEGSYNHLAATMAELKKQWKATADEVKRNEIGQQIDTINSKLKELDGTIGNNQRLVGSYAEEFKKALAEQDDATIGTRTKLESLQKVATGLASGYAAVQGAMTLLNIENENLQKAMVKVQSAMAIAQGVGGMKDLVEGLSRAKVAFGGAINGCKMFITGLSGVKKAIIGTGIGALVVAVGLLIAHWDTIAKKLGIVKKEQSEVNEVIKKNIEIENTRNEKINSSIGTVLGKYKLLQKQWKELSTDQQKNTWIKENQTAFNQLGIAVGSVNDAQKVFIDNSPLVIKALKDQARARAMASLYEEAIAKQFKAQKKFDEEKKTAQSKYPEGYRPSSAEETAAGLNDNDFLTVTVENSWFAQNIQGKPRLEAKPTDAVDYTGSQKLQNQYLKPVRDEVTALNNEVAILEKAYTEAEESAAASMKAIKQAGINVVSGTATGGGGGGKTPAEEAAEAALENAKTIAERARKALIDTEKEELEELERVYLEEKALLAQHGIDTAKLTDEYTKNKAAIEKKYRKEKERLDAEADAKAKKYYEEKVAESEKRLTAKLGGIDKDTESKLYLNERNKPDGNGEINAIDNELAKLETLKNITNETLNLKVAAIEAEQALFKESSERWKELELEKVAIKEQTTRSLNEISEQYAEQEKARQKTVAKSITNTFTSALNSASQIISALQDGIDTSNKEGFEKNKKMQIANATIGMLVGITNAMAGAYTSKTGPWDWILAGIQAATIATVGGIQIANIKKQTFDGGGDSGAGVSPSSIGINTEMPVAYTRNLMGDAETETLNQEQRVYILESDIEESGRRVEVRDSNTNF